MSALKFPALKKSQLMSVMPETSQCAMRPYVAMAAVGSVLYAWTAVLSDALSATGTQSILGYEVSCVLPVGTVPRRITQWPPPPVRTPPHASPAAMQAVLAAVMLP